METGVLFLLVIVLLLIGAPIAIALGLSSVLTIILFSDDSLASIALKLFEAMEKYTLLAIPFFILSSAFMSTGGVAQRIIRFAIACVGHLRGGLAISSVFACMLFAALSGSSPATVVAIGTIVIAGMVQVGYSKQFAAGVICNAGTLGILIPPSIVMVVYAAATDVSVGRMFMGGVIPGLLAGLMLMIGIYIAARISNLPKQPWAGLGEIAGSFADAAFGLFLIVIILGGIYGGIFTPTEAAAVASIYAFLIALLVYRDMGPLRAVPWLSDEEKHVAPGATGLVMAFLFMAELLAVLWVAYLAIDAMIVSRGGPDVNRFMGIGIGLCLVAALAVVAVRRLMAGAGVVEAVPLGTLVGNAVRASLRNLKVMTVALLPATVHPDTRKTLLEAGRVTLMLMFIIANALLFAHVLTTERIPQVITEAIVGAGLAPWTFLVVVNLLLLAGGQFMEPSGLLLIMAPILFPVAIELGIDPIHLGIIMVVNMEIGMITPPVGLNLFVTSGITGMSVVEVVKAALPWLMILVVFLILVTYVPWLSTWLPTLLFGPQLT